MWEWLASSPIATTSLTIQRKPPLSLRLLRIDDLRLAISSPSAAYRTTRRSPDPVWGASDEKRRRLRRRWLSIAIAIISLAVVALFLAWLPQLGDRGLEGDHRHLPGTAQPTPRNAHALDPRSASTGTNQPQGQPSFALPGQAQVIASSSGSGDVLVTFATSVSEGQQLAFQVQGPAKLSVDWVLACTAGSTTATTEGSAQGERSLADSLPFPVPRPTQCTVRMHARVGQSQNVTIALLAVMP